MLQDQIQQDYITAFKAKDSFTSETLKMLRAALKNLEIENRMKEQGDQPLTDEETITVLRTELKKRQEAIELYAQGGRQDLVDKETKEAHIIEKYLPSLMKREELEEEVEKMIQQLGSGADFGKIMGTTMAALKGKADGKVVSEVVKEKLKGS